LANRDYVAIEMALRALRYEVWMDGWCIDDGWLNEEDAHNIRECCEIRVVTRNLNDEWSEWELFCTVFSPDLDLNE